MTNLPIAHKPSPPPARGIPGSSPLHRIEPPASSGNIPSASHPGTSSGNQAAKTAQSNSGISAGSTVSTASNLPGGLSVTAESHAEIAAPFSELLARQIDEVDAHSPGTVQNSLGADSIASTTVDADPEKKESQEQAAITANAAEDASSIVAAMLLQIPVSKDTAHATKSHSSPPLNKVSGEAKQKVEDEFQQAAENLPIADKKFQTEPAGLIPLKTKVIEPAQVAANSSNSIQASTNNTQAPIPSTLTAVMANMPSPNSVETTQTITTPLGNTGWTDEFAQKINWMSTQKVQIAELHLTPPDLGPVNVVLKISSNQATVLFTSAHSVVRDALENALPRLRDIFADNGIILGDATVSDQSAQDRSQGRQMNQEFGSLRQESLFDKTSNSAGLTQEVSHSEPLRRHNGMVDTFA